MTIRYAIAVALRHGLWRNQAEPGSTFKIVVASAALNEKLVDLNTLVNCENGSWRSESLEERLSQ